jgi:CTP synthase (UTP-ammonia lyase)
VRRYNLNVTVIVMRYNSAYDVLQNAGLKASGVNPDTGLVEIVELEDHPFSSGYNTIQNIKVPLQTHPIL